MLASLGRIALAGGHDGAQIFGAGAVSLEGCCGSVYLLTQDPAFSHRVQTAGGYLREEAERQLKAFFENRRSRQS